MTSTPVMGSIGSQSVNLLNSVQNQSKSTGTDFKNFMNQSTSGSNESNDVTAKTGAQNGVRKNEDLKNEDVKTENSGKTEEVTGISKQDSPKKEVEDRDVKNVTEAIGDVEEVIKEEFDVTEEDIINALNALSLSVFALLNETNLPNVVAQITNTEDVLGLATDENLYSKLTTITEAVVNIKDELLANLDIPKEDFENALLSVESADDVIIADTNVETVTEDAVITPKAVISNFYEDISNDISRDIQGEFVTGNTEEVNVKAADTGAANEPVKTEAKSFEEKINVTNFERSKANVSNMDKKAEVPADLKETEVVFDSSKLRRESEFKGNEDFSNNQMNFAQNLLTKAAEVMNENSQAVSYSTFEVENIMNQITESIDVSVTSEMSEISLRLHPESLGTVNVKVSANHEGVLTATFTAQNESVKAVIESQAVVLKEVLESKGVTVEAVEVAVQSHQFERNLNEQNRGREDAEPKKKGIRRINLSDPLEEVLDEGDSLIKEMMVQSGNTVDYSA